MNHLKNLYRGAYPNVADLCLVMGIFLLSQAFAGAVMGLTLGTDPDALGLSIFISYASSFLITIIFALAQKHRRTGRKGPLLRMSFNAAGPLVSLWGFVMIMALGVVIEPLLEAFPDRYFDMLERLMGAGVWMMGTSIILAPIMEEILFRGIIQESLTTKYGPAAAILVTSVIFGLIHVNPPQAINAFFISIILGYVYLLTRSILPVMLVHALNNGVAYFQYVVTGGETMSLREMIDNPAIYETVYYVSVVICLIAAFTITMRLSRKRRKDLPADKVDESGNNTSN